MNFEGRRFDVGAEPFDTPKPLAHEPGFVIGPLTVEPALRRIETRGGEHAILEPLAMHVLIALAQANGAPCSRDDLIGQCWGRRYVGDDSINRVVSTLRRHLSAVAGSGVGIETISKVGYRLHFDGQDSGGVARPTPERSDSETNAEPIFSRWKGFAAAAAALVVGGTAYALQPAGEPASLSLAITADGAKTGDRLTRLFVSNLTNDISRLSGANTRFAFVEPGSSPSAADMVMLVSAGRDGSAVVSELRLVEGQSRAIVWSQAFRDDSGSVAHLNEQTAMAVADILRCGLDRSTGHLGDPVSQRIYFGACAAAQTGDWAKAKSFARQMVARWPEASGSWACLALTSIIAAQGDPRQLRRVVGEARASAERALAIDERSGLAYQALAMVYEAEDRPVLSLLEKGVAADPEHPGLQARYARALFNTGYVREAVEPALRAVTLGPYELGLRKSAAYQLLGAGQHGEARRIRREIERIWSNPRELRPLQAVMAFADPDPRAALARLRSAPPPDPDLAAMTATELEWRIAPGEYDWSRFDMLAEQSYRSNPEKAWQMALIAARMGDRERGLRWLDRAPETGRRGEWWFVFWPGAASLRQDSRFFAKMHAVGLVDEWQRRGKWPDFCFQSKLAYDCRTEAAQLLRRRAATTSS